ncbi:MAG: response regulator [Verrucomicrobia bacterium]|nr:response regulator [Verrucomicrobiota bacterium]
MRPESMRPAAVAPLVLVVEDQPLLQELLVRLLIDAGYPTLAVGDADQAYALWSQAPRRFHLIITDIMMPSRLNGITLGRLLKERQPDLPVLYMSASQEVEASADLVEGKNFFRKPFSPTTFLETVARTLERVPMPAAHHEQQETAPRNEDARPVACAAHET